MIQEGVLFICGFLPGCVLAYVLLYMHWRRHDTCKHEWECIRDITYVSEGERVGEKLVYQCAKCHEVKSVKLDGMVDDDFIRH